MSKPDSRDRGLEALLSARTPRSPSSDACLDAETLAAWADGGLDDTQRHAAESHVSDCARCQALLATIVRSEPAPAPAASLWDRLGLKWLVPLTAAATALVLWVTAPPTSPEAPADTVAMSQPSEIARPADTPPAPPARPEADRNEAAAANEPAQSAPPAPSVPATPSAIAPGSSARGRADVPASEAEPKREVARDADARQEFAKQAARDALNDTASLERRQPAEARTAAAPPPAPQTGAVETIGRRTGGLASALEERVAPRIDSRDPAVQWRVSGPGVIERSTDGGTSWARLDTGHDAPITAGDSPSATVCWLVGPRGLVLLTTDARTWEQTSSPTGADLVGVEASDRNAATVHTASGERFRTSDGGRTWSPVP